MSDESYVSSESGRDVNLGRGVCVQTPSRWRLVMTDNPGTPNRYAPGWYLDPYNQDLLRWWDGTHWTEPTRPIPRERPMPAQSRRPLPTNNRGGWRPTASVRAHQGGQSGKQLPTPNGKTEDFSALREMPPSAGHVRNQYTQSANAAPRAPYHKQTAALTPLDNGLIRQSIMTLGLTALFAVSLMTFR